MKAAIIGASEEALHTIEKAKEAGVEVIALDGNAAAAGLKAADKGMVVDISDREAVLECLRQEQIDFVLTVPVGRYLTTAGAVNDAFHLPGISEAAALRCVDKYEFHRLLSQQGMRDCRCMLVGKEPLDKLTFPSILKPRFGSGSRGIFYLEKEEDLRKALSETEKAAEDYLAEEILPGEEYGIDAVVKEETLYPVLLRRKLQTPLPARQAVAYLSVVPAEEPALYRQVREYMQKAARVLGLQDCLLHADLMIAGEKVQAVELSARPSGHNLHNLFTPLATGIDMAEEFLNYLCRKPCCFEPKQVRKMMIRYFDLQGLVLEVTGEKEAEELIGRIPDISLLEYSCSIQKGQYLNPVNTGHSLMGRGHFILEGAKEQPLKEAGERLLSSFRLKRQALALITARGGSKRLPGKNRKEFCGKPILCYSIEAARESGVFDTIMVSTDDLEIAGIAKRAGAEIPFLRSLRTSDDFASTDDVIMEVLEEYEKRGIVFETFCCIYPTAPFITGPKLQKAMELLKEADSVMPVVKFSYPPQRGIVIEDGKLRRKYPQYRNTRSQDLEPLYHDCGQFYACRQEPFRKAGTTDVENLIPMIMPEMEVQDIDTLEDWAIAELKYQQMLSSGGWEE